MKILKEYKGTIIFVVIMIICIIALVSVEITNDKKSEEKLKENNDSKKVELIEPTEYQDLTEDKYPVATITMTDGKQIKIQLFPNIAPNTVENFIALANSGFYDGLTFHRTIPEFMVQGGDKEGTGSGQLEFSIAGEFESNGYKNDLSHVEGIISMARTSLDMNSAGSQFFITTADVSQSLDGDYAAFGKVIEGMETVKEIENVEVITREYGAENADRPVNPPVIKKITVETFGIQYNEPERIMG